METKRIAILDDYLDSAVDLVDWSLLDVALKPKGAVSDIQVFHHPTVAMSETEIAEMLLPFQVLLVMRERTPLPASLIEKLKNLQLIVTSGMRNQAIDIVAAKKQGITVCGTASPPHSTAELAFAMMMALARGLVAHHNSVAAGGWQLLLGGTLRDASLGILGLGRIGEIVAKMAMTFGMHISAYSENLTQERCSQVGVAYANKQALFKNSDFISIHLKASARTKNFVGKQELAWMKPSAYLINTSRQSIVDYNALALALEKGKIAGAGLDVFATEPLPLHDPLRKMKNTILTPHIGYASRENYRLYYSQMLKATIAFYTDTPVGKL